MMEENLRRALLLSRGDWSVFVTRPLSAGLLVAALLLLVHRAAAGRQDEARRGLRRGKLIRRRQRRTVDMTVARHLGCSRGASRPQFWSARCCMSLSLGRSMGGGPRR